MSSKMISVSLPEEMLPAIDAAARREHRSRSEFIREALRHYIKADRGRYVPAVDPDPEEIEAIRASRKDFAKGKFVHLEDLQRELGLKIK
jgi:Arc/MetJ-type ribon-helix-helix transcriptional regulator